MRKIDKKIYNILSEEIGNRLDKKTTLKLTNNIKNELRNAIKTEFVCSEVATMECNDMHTPCIECYRNRIQKRFGIK